uniref:hypothetical protein n=1 Tax=Candidatus Wujingus californicus TaxID=3367618 RepID=UPI004027B710
MQSEHVSIALSTNLSKITKKSRQIFHDRRFDYSHANAELTRKLDTLGKNTKSFFIGAMRTGYLLPKRLNFPDASPMATRRKQL